ncbi:MAG: methyltransferase domain-containing protein [Acidobacteria bacterium]|nr:methyltransferase domain-containing protein [Acidobacteriota bacterium]
MSESELVLVADHRTERMPVTIADRTRRTYDRLAAVYPLSTYCFHSKAHRRALEMSGVRDGMRVLEVATGSGEMFRRLVKSNPNGHTVGVDLSPNMAARTQSRIAKEFPDSTTLCQAVDARHLPFRDESFDAVFACYLLELLSYDDITRTLAEIRRVLRERGTLTVVLIGQNTRTFNRLYRIGGSIAPSFWGRQVDTRVPEMLEAAKLHVRAEETVCQTFYPSRVLTARK